MTNNSQVSYEVTFIGKLKQNISLLMELNEQTKKVEDFNNIKNAVKERKEMLKTF